MSVLSNWNDINLRKVILFPGMEEGYFYEPTSVHLDIKAMIVITVRNSLIEDILSTKESAIKLGLTKPVIDDKDIYNITRQSIEYFSDIDLTAWVSQLVNKFSSKSLKLYLPNKI